MHAAPLLHNPFLRALVLLLLWDFGLPRTFAQTERRGPNAISTRDGRKLIVQKLNETVIDSYEAPNGRKLGDVVNDLARLSRDSTRDKSGVNFIFSSQMEKPGLVGLQSSTDSSQGSKPVRVADYEVTI